MSLLVKRNGLSLPSVVSDFFDTGRMFPSLFDAKENPFGIGKETMVVPEANIIENEKDYRIEIAAPGLDRKDFKVSLDNDVLTISSEKTEEKKEEVKNYRRKEFSYSAFMRSFTLPENCISEKIDAKYENGILHISLPKKEIKISKPAKEIKVS
jgi:HSP20 family protein